MIAIECNSLAPNCQSRELPTLLRTSTILALPLYPVLSAMTCFRGMHTMHVLWQTEFLLVVVWPRHFSFLILLLRTKSVFQNMSEADRSGWRENKWRCSEGFMRVKNRHPYVYGFHCRKSSNMPQKSLTRFVDQNNFLQYLSALRSKILSLC